MAVARRMSGANPPLPTWDGLSRSISQKEMGPAAAMPAPTA